MKKFISLSLLILLATSFAYRHNVSKDRVLLSSIDTLTFYRSRYTTGNRSRPIPQMTCLGGSASCKYMPSSMQCYNRGSDGRDVQWECKAELDNGVSLGETTVSCEGYDYPEDPYILAGSCGVEFYLNKNSDYQHSNYHSSRYTSSWSSPSNWFWSFFDSLKTLAIFFLVIIWIIGLIGLNALFKFIWFVMKVVFFPIYLFTLCCCGSSRRRPYNQYNHFMPPPPVFDNTWGHGFARHTGAPYREHYEHHDYYHDSSDDTHTSTSYASTSRR